MRPMRLALFALLLPALLSSGPAVLADEGEPAAPAAAPSEAAKPEPKTDPKPPSFSIEFLMPEEDSKLEGDWKVKDAQAPANAPSEGVLVALAEKLGLDEDTFYAEETLLEKGDEIVAVTMVDVDKKVQAFRAAVDERAGQNGWRVRELGSPCRLLIVGGSAGALASAEKAVVGHTIYRFGGMAMGRLRGHGGLEDAGLQMAQTYGKAVDAVVPDTGVSYVIKAGVEFVAAHRKVWKGKKGAKIDEKRTAKAMDFFGKALMDGVVYPPKERMLWWSATKLGDLYIKRKDKSLVPGAVRAYEIAVEHEKHAKNQSEVFGNRYNLACAYALDGQTLKSLETLRRSLEIITSLPGDEPRIHWENAEEDKDLDSIRSDPRFSKILYDSEPDKRKGYDVRKAAREKQKKADEARKKKEAEEAKKKKESGDDSDDDDSDDDDDSEDDDSEDDDSDE